ncbi:hypothetical protein DFH28DRAFT_1085052 [Melampsora americana]|nr:hypothetical protein DFH28DRAFT_1085052 [Melampsora americana]
MDRPKLPPLHMALRQSIEDFDHQSRRNVDSGSMGGRLGLSVSHSPGRRSVMLSNYSPSRPGDLSMYSLGSSPLSCTQSHLATSRNSANQEPLHMIHQSPYDSQATSLPRGGERTSSHSHSQPVSASPSHRSSAEMNSRRRSNSAVNASSYQGFPPTHLSHEYHPRNGFYQASPRISFLEGEQSSSPEAHHPRRQSRLSNGHSGSSHYHHPNLRNQNSPLYELPQSLDPSDLINSQGGRSQITNPCLQFSNSRNQNQTNFTEPVPPPKWVCDYAGCGKTFTRGFNLTQHKAAIHRDERRFECAYCAATFYRRNDLARHERSHTGERPYKCECGQSFTRTDLLTRHKQYGNCSYHNP